MAFDENNYSATLNTAVNGSFNDDETDNLDVDVSVSDSGNTDNSTNDSNNLTATATDSFHWGSHNTHTSTDDSGNTGSYNSMFDASDHSVDDHSDSSTNDNSINAGVRSYNTGFGDVGGAAAAAGEGSTSIQASSNLLDQSVNGNIAAFGPVFQKVSSEAVVGSGDAMVAGDDLTVTYNVDQSTSIFAKGDVLIDSSKSVTEAVHSYNTSDFSWSHEDNSIDVDIDDSGNTWTHTTEIGDSFNDDVSLFSDTDVDVDVDAIVGSTGAAIGDDFDITL